MLILLCVKNYISDAERGQRGTQLLASESQRSLKFLRK